MSNREIDALINLIEDPDEGVYLHVRSELESYGEMVLPQLEYYWESHELGPLFQERIEHLIQSIQYQSIYQRLKTWKETPDNDLLDGMLIINRYQYPSFDEDELRNRIQGMRQDLWLELNDNLTALETIRVFNHMIYQYFGFGVSDDGPDPQLLYLTDILSSKQGNALSLGIIYRILAQRTGIPIYGVSLPTHFILCYVNEVSFDLNELLLENPEWELWPPDELSAEIDSVETTVLFYVNPANSGSILVREDLEQFVSQSRMPYHDHYFEPCANNELLSRMLSSLIQAYMEQNKPEKVRELSALHSIFLEK